MKKLTTREMVLCALFVAAMAVLSQIIVPMPGVPFNLGVLGVFLCGGMLRKGAALLSLLCYLLLGAVGVPVFAGFGAGPSALLGPTGGYLVAYPLMAWLVAWLIQIWAGECYWKRAGAMALSLIPCYLLGTAWLAVYLDKSFAAAAMAACVPFIPFDLLKALLAAGLTRSLSQRLRMARP
jgi:biotin transport system substrate-specific component